MEECEIKVNEYVRTPEEGYIGKLVEIIPNVLNYYKIDVKKEIRRTNGMSDNYIYSRDGFGLKHSFNIIDLIEVGDYVNGHKVIDIAEAPKRAVYLEDIKQQGALIPYTKDDIQTILTKQQFKNIEYKIGE